MGGPAESRRATKNGFHATAGWRYKIGCEAAADEGGDPTGHSKQALEFSGVYYNSKCNKCDQAATHKFMRLENGQVFDIFLCPQHAAEMSPYQKQNNLSEILEGLLKHDPKIKVMAPVQVPTGIRCKSCGLAYESYRKNYILGCSDCYDSFRDLLIQDLRKFHGGARHVGRGPGGSRLQLPEGEAAMPVPPGEQGGKFGGGGMAAAKEAGGLPSKGAAVSKLIDDLQRKLNAAIATEDFAGAARYRDQIRQLREKFSK